MKKLFVKPFSKTEKVIFLTISIGLIITLLIIAVLDLLGFNRHILNIIGCVSSAIYLVGLFYLIICYHVHDEE